MEYETRRNGQPVDDLPEGANVVTIVDADGTDAFQATMVADGVLVAVGPWRPTVEEAGRDFPELRHPAGANPTPRKRLKIGDMLGRKPAPVVLPKPAVRPPDPDPATPEGMVVARARAERIPNIDEFLAMGLELKAAGLACLAHLQGDRDGARAFLVVARDAARRTA